MLTAIPRSWFSWDFTLTDGDTRLGDIDFSTWREKGELKIAGAPYRVYREAVLGPFVLESGGSVVARAVKPSSLSRRMVIDCGHSQYELQPASFFSRGFQLVAGSTPVGTLSASNFLTRRMNIDLPDSLPLPVRAFVAWLVIMLWRRDASAAT
jgi:hypothetical protein